MHTSTTVALRNFTLKHLSAVADRKVIVYADQKKRVLENLPKSVGRAMRAAGIPGNTLSLTGDLGKIEKSQFARLFSSLKGTRYTNGKVFFANSAGNCGLNSKTV